jgi:transposase InsO family protein
MTADLVIAAMNMALAQRKPRSVIHHSDQGSQGEFNRSSQHLHQEKLRWVFRSMEGVVAASAPRWAR